MALLALAAVAGGLGAQQLYNRGLIDTLDLRSIPAAVSSIGKPFGLCHEDSQPDCVIDGETIEYMGERIRMVDYDAPEIVSPRCPYEQALGHRAKGRLLELLNSGPVAVMPYGDSDVDKYGRKLRLVTVSGQSVGNFLIGEGLAAPWEGHHHQWCG